MPPTRSTGSACSTPKALLIDRLGPGEVGFITAAIKEIADARVGDTITDDRKPADAPLPGFRPSQPVVFCGMYPTDADEYGNLRDSLGKLRLNDASFEYEPESSSALGLGFRCGFLGLLHLEIIQERLEREFDLDIVITAPSVVYRVHQSDGQVLELHNPADYPDPTRIDHVEEPWIKATILVPDEFLGSILQLCTEKRGVQQELTYVGNRAMVVYRLPLNEVVYDFYDRLKSISRGYASFDYHLDGYATTSLHPGSGDSHTPRRSAAAARSAPRSRSGSRASASRQASTSSAVRTSNRPISWSRPISATRAPRLGTIPPGPRRPGRAARPSACGAPRRAPRRARARPAASPARVAVQDPRAQGRGQVLDGEAAGGTPGGASPLGLRHHNRPRRGAAAGRRQHQRPASTSAAPAMATAPGRSPSTSAPSSTAVSGSASVSVAVSPALRLRNPRANRK